MRGSILIGLAAAFVALGCADVRSGGRVAGPAPSPRGTPRRPTGLRLQAFGTQGALEFPVLRVWSHRDAAHTNWNEPIAAAPVKTLDRDPYVEQIRHLRAVIEGREAPIVSGVDGTRTLAATLAIHESARTGAPVDLARDHARIEAAVA